MQSQVPYKDAVKRRYPEQVAIAIVKDEEGKYNPITLSWTMLTSHEPPLMAISVGLTRHSLDAIRHAGEFVIGFPSSAMAEDAVFFGKNSGRDLDKLAERGTKTQPASVIDGVLLAEGVANFECRLVSELQTGDHVIFVGKVLAAHVNARSDVGRLYALGEDHPLGGVVRE